MRPFFPIFHWLAIFPVSVFNFYLRNPAPLDFFLVGIKIENLFRNYLIVLQFRDCIAAAQYPLFKFGIRPPYRLSVDISVPLVVFPF